MKYNILMLSAMLALAACDYGKDTPKPEVVDMPVSFPEICNGKLKKIDGLHLKMICDDGKVVHITSYKYHMTIKRLQ